MDQRLTVQLFGPPRLLLGETPLKIRRRTSFALLVYLTLTRRPHARESLVALIAGEMVDQRARHAFRNALTELRQLIGDYLVLRGDTIALNVSCGVWVDVAEFEAAMAGQSGAITVPQAQTAVALHHDDLLAGFGLPNAPAFEDWLVRERLRLRDLQVRAMQMLLDHHVKHRAIGEAMELANRLLALEPWREEVHRELMRLLAQSGQRSAAIAQYHTCCEILFEELHVEPDAATSELYAQLSAAPAAPPNNLPQRLSSLVGRAHELDVLSERLADPDCQIITILGMGGVGKTRLALELAAGLARPSLLAAEQRFADGVFLVSLPDCEVSAAGGERASTAVDALVAAIDEAVFPGQSQRVQGRRQLLVSLRAKRMLLIIDNAEQVLAGSQFLSDLVSQAPLVTLLVTSRVRLALQEEWVLELHGLSVPDGPAAVEQAAAGRVFLEQARRVHLGRPPATADYPHIVRICAAVQGLPLALILAAPLLQVFSCADLAVRLEDDPDLLETAVTNIPERQRSVRASIDWSWRYLSSADRIVLSRLTLFRNGFDWQAAREIAGANVHELRVLRDMSLLECDPSGRYRMHTLVRRFVQNQSPGRAVATSDLRSRHAAHYAGLVSQSAVAISEGSDAFELVTTEQQNIQVAWEWAIAHQQHDALEQMRQGMVAWFQIAGRFAEGATFFAEAAIRLPSRLDGPRRTNAALEITRGFILSDAAHFYARTGQVERAQALLEEAMNVAQALGALGLEAYTVFHSGALWGMCSPNSALRYRLWQPATERPDIAIAGLEPAGRWRAELAAV